MEQVTEILRGQFPIVGGKMFTPNRDNSSRGLFAGCESQRLVEFNPTSRDHIAWILVNRFQWEPKVFTPLKTVKVKGVEKTSGGKIVIDEVILTEIGTPFAISCAKALDLKKKLGMLSEGVNAWQKLCTTSKKIHHSCSVATYTHRCAHQRPNLSQVPAETAFRELFTASPGMVMVGADLAGIELRMLAHYLGRYDGGKYTDILLNDDVHQVNADKIGISRRQCKTVSYAFLYGAGNLKLGLSFDPQLSEAKARKKGAEIRKAYVEAIDGLGPLLEGVRKATTERGFVFAIDKRKIPVDSPHKGLNYLLQSSAGVIAKRMMVLAHERAPNTARQLAFIHDEIQYEVHKHQVDELKFLLELSAVEAGEYYNMRCPTAADSKTGLTWADVH